MAKKEKTKAQLLQELKEYQDKYNEQEQIIEYEHKLAIDSIKEAKYLYEESPAISLIIGQYFEIQDVNKKTLEILSYSKEDLIEKPFLELVDADQREDVFMRLSQNFQDQSNEKIECNIIDSRGMGHTILFSYGHPLSYKGMKIESILITGMDITEMKKKEEEKNTLITKFVEHVKHLNCLYEISKLVADPEISVDGLFERIMRLIPSALQPSDVVCVRITSNQKSYQTANFRRTKWKLAVDLEVEKGRTGEIEIYYLEEKPKQDIGSFFIEEKHLLKAIGEHIGRFLQFKAVTNELKTHRDKLEELVQERTLELKNINQQLQQEIEEGKRREAFIAKQSAEILELSTPVLKIIEGVIVVPLIGTLDSHRTQHFMEILLQAIVDTNSRVSMIDITGVPMIDTQTGQHLMETINAIKLLGAQVILTGVRPAIAQTLVHLGIDLSDIETQASLARGLFNAMKILGYQVTKHQHPFRSESRRRL